MALVPSSQAVLILLAAAVFLTLVILTPTVFISDGETHSPVLLKIVTQNTTLNLFAGPGTNTHLENITQYDAIPYRI